MQPSWDIVGDFIVFLCVLFFFGCSLIRVYYVLIKLCSGPQAVATKSWKPQMFSINGCGVRMQYYRVR